MINNPKIIEEIKKQLENTTKQQLQEAIILANEEYIEQNSKIKIEKNDAYYMEEKYTIFKVHKKRTRHILNIFKKDKMKEIVKELEAA